jgi:hypothetical protein
VSTVANLLHSASRPVLLRLPNHQKHLFAQSALNAVSNRLRNKLGRGLPFPPATTTARREEELDYERTVAGIQTLEAQLDPLLHGVALLEKEKERVERELERDYKVLNSLSINARSEGRQRREQLRKMHALVPPPPNHEGDESSAKESALGDILPADKSAGKTFVNLESEDLTLLASQIGSHMESMRGNLQQIEGVAPAVTEGQAALRMTLLPHLDKGSYEQVLLG